jgi:peroxiredoxin family protein
MDTAATASELAAPPAAGDEQPVGDMTRDQLRTFVNELILARESEVRDPNMFTLIAWGGDLDRIWPTTILATTAAASGMDVAVFFTFWGLFPIVREDVRITGTNWMTKALSLMNRGSAAHAGLSKLNMGGSGPKMMRKLAKDNGVAAPEELLEMAKELDVKLWPCRMTMDLMGIKDSDLISGLDEPAGAATALERMKRSALSLFI